jgi:hypothetical protein
MSEKKKSVTYYILNFYFKLKAFSQKIIQGPLNSEFKKTVVQFSKEFVKIWID